MYSKVNVFPNYEDEEEKVVRFSMHFALDGEGVQRLDEFQVDIVGYIPASDSVIHLREMAKEKAMAILRRLVEAK